MVMETTLPIREQIMALKKSGVSLSEIAARLGLSHSCVRKIWRRGRDLGEQGLERLSRRPHHAPPHQIPERQRQAILEIRRQHPKWGGQFIQGELRRRRFRNIPHRRTIERFLHQHPDITWQTHLPRPAIQDSRRATQLHQLWQMDFIVEKKLKGAPHKYSFLQVRDMASTKSVLKYTLPAGRSALTTQETIQATRQAFINTGYLPKAIRSDHGSCFVGTEPGSFPSNFTLWLWGLGVEHELIPIRCPRQNGGVERDQRTFAEHFLEDHQFMSHEHLESETKDWEKFQNQYVPSRSIRCEGRTANETATTLKCTAPRYREAREERMFSVDRIYEKLAQLRWRRKLTSGYASLGHHRYYVGIALKGQEIEVHFDRANCELVFSATGQKEIKRWPIRGISYEEIVKEPDPPPVRGRK